MPTSKRRTSRLCFPVLAVVPCPVLPAVPPAVGPRPTFPSTQPHALPALFHSIAVTLTRQCLLNRGRA